MYTMFKIKLFEPQCTISFFGQIALQVIIEDLQKQLSVIRYITNERGDVSVRITEIGKQFKR